MSSSSLLSSSWRFAVGVGLAAVLGACSAIRADEPSQTPGGEAEPALTVLRDLAPARQEEVIAGIERSHRRGEIGEQQIPLLAGLVGGSSWTEANRRRIAFLLASLGEPGEAALDDLSYARDGAVRNIAIDALRWAAILKRTRAEDYRQREAAIQELPRVAEAHPSCANLVLAALAEAYTRKDEPRLDVRVAALRGLARFGERSAPTLVETLAQPDAFFFQYTKAALKAIGSSARPALLDGLQHRDPLVRQRVIYVLLEMGIDDEAVQAIRRLEHDADESVRKAVDRAKAAYRPDR